MLASMGAVAAGHATDLWGVGLVTMGVLGAVAFYGGSHSLGPTGNDARIGVGDLLGWGRFLVPPILIAVGVRMFMGRGEDPAGEGGPRREPARAVIGGILLLLAATGMAALAGGSPAIGASTAALSSAGGWVGAVIADPLGTALGGFGAAVILVVVAAVALLVFTGVTVRSVASAMARAVRWAIGAARGDRAAETVDDPTDPDEPTDPFGRALAQGRQPSVATAAPDVDEAAGVAVDPDPDVHDGVDPSPDDELVPVVLSEAATRPGKGEQLEMRMGPALGDWKLPPSTLLKRAKAQVIDETEVDAAGAALVHALSAHGVETRLVGRTVGPSVTRYELELGAGVKVARVTSLSKDIAYAMASPDVRILAPIPGKSAIGVEVPNRRRQLVALGDIMASAEAARATHPLEVALGRDIAGRAVVANLAEMPHVLVSGSTGSGKSSCINSVLTSILIRATPDQVRFILIDPKRVELGQYNDLPHLLTQVVVDPKKAANALSWAVTEMERRYDLLAEVGQRDITGYNQAFDSGDLGEYEEAYRLRMQGTVGEVDEDDDSQIRFPRLPFILIVVDELNDLMMVAARDVEESVCRIAQMARAVGIHLVLATQRPSVDVITGVIKANVPSRMAFSVSSLADSRVILDQPGAERLIGKGDMLLLTASSSNPQRIQGPWVSEEEVRAVVAHWKRQRPMEIVAGIEEVVAAEGPRPGGDVGDDDELLDQALELVVRSQLGSTSMLQRKLRVGFARAGRLMDLMERRGVVGPSEGSKARTVLMTPEELDAR
jgi:S-DNA-T family DNA segregation ATPase FtsK/SpoIIIE